MLRASDEGLIEKLDITIRDFLSQSQNVITERQIDSTLESIKRVLVDADVNIDVTNSIIQRVKSETVGMKLAFNQKPGEQFMNILAASLVDIMGSTESPLAKRDDGAPTTIVLLGLQGAGKTTAAAKLAYWMITYGHSQQPLLVALDIYRPAAIEQLQILGKKINVHVYSEPNSRSGVKLVDIARRAITKAVSEGYDTVIFDTAGRQVLDEKMMEELREICAAVNPDELLLVVDAMTGQEAAFLTAKYYRCDPDEIGW